MAPGCCVRVFVSVWRVYPYACVGLWGLFLRVCCVCARYCSGSGISPSACGVWFMWQAIASKSLGSGLQLAMRRPPG